MALFIFDGSTSLNLSDFDPEVDQVVFEGVNAVDVASLTQTNSSVSLTLTNGSVLTLQGVIFASLTASSFVAGDGSDLAFAIGTSDDDTGLDGNVVVGLAGGDEITATTDDALINGNQGNDTIAGGDLENLRIFGGAGDDEITTFADGSVVYGGIGADTITATVGTAESTGVTVYGGNGNADSVDGADEITGSDGDDLIFGNGGDDTILAGEGDNTVYGGQGEDNITAGDGNDLIFGNIGADTIVAGDGENTVYGGQDADDITGGADADLLFGNVGDDTIAGGGGADTIYGGQGNDEITLGVVGADDDAIVYGNLGNDTIDGSAAVEGATLLGNEGEDFITGGAGDDVIYGGQDNDVIVASEGNDTIFGGQGEDSFDFTAAAATTEDNIALIGDFNFDQDTIQFADQVNSVATANLTTAADLADVSALASATADQAVIVTVASGDLAGSYVVFDEQIVEITGYTGTIDADAFGVATV